MRCIILLLLIAYSIQSKSQSFVTYKDTINGFSISIPEGWKYGINKNIPAIKLIAYRLPTTDKGTLGLNFNINIIETPGKDLEKTFADFVKYLPGTKNYRLLDQGERNTKGAKLKWLIETHTVENTTRQLHNYDFVALKNGKTYILTMVTASSGFEAVKSLFDKIADSLILF